MSPVISLVVLQPVRMKVQKEGAQSFCIYLGFTPCKVEQPLQGMQLQENKDRVKGIPKKLFKKNPYVKTASLLWS